MTFIEWFRSQNFSKRRSQYQWMQAAWDAGYRAALDGWVNNKHQEE
jgi:hypothetical protein